MTPQEFFKNDLFAENAGVVLLDFKYIGYKVTHYK